MIKPPARAIVVQTSIIRYFIVCPFIEFWFWATLCPPLRNCNSEHCYNPFAKVRRVSNSETRNPKSEIPHGGTKPKQDHKKWDSSDFDFRTSFGLRISGFGF